MERKLSRRFVSVCLGVLMVGGLAISVGSLTTLVNTSNRGSFPTGASAWERFAGLKIEPKPYDKPAEAQEFYHMKRAPAGSDAIPMERYGAALEKMKNMRLYSTALDSYVASGESAAKAAGLGTWVPLGPGNIGGRTRALLIDPGTPATMFAAGVAGGIWKTTNAGTTWSALDDMMANLAVNSMAMDPGNSSVIYAGTGEGFFNGDRVRGAGIFKTANGGTNWARLSNTNTSNFHYVNDIVVSPNSSSRVYAATRTGVWRSINSGTDWTRVYTPSEARGCLDLAVRTDVGPTDTVFASCGTFEQATVYRNTDAGGAGSWSSVLTESNMGRTSLAIAPSNENTIYALSASIQSGSNYEDGLHAVFRSTNGGTTWPAQVRNTDSIKLNTVLLSNTWVAHWADCSYASQNLFINQGWYDNVIAVDPMDENVVWVGGIDLFRSNNGGADWGLASHWWADITNPRYNHADQHAIVFHPDYDGSTNKTMYVGNDGGVFKTDDALATTATGASAPCNTGNGSVAWTELNNNYGVTQFYHGAPYPDGLTYFGGTQDNGTLRGNDSSGSEAWNEIRGGDGGYVAVDPNNTNILYAENTGLSIVKSTDGGLNFNIDATTGITDGGCFLFIAPFVMDSSNSQRLWTGGCFIWRTTNGAGSWTQASTITTGAGSVSALASAPSNPNYVLAGMSDGYIHRTTIGLTSDSSTSWSFTRPVGGDAYVSSVAFDPNNENIAYATYSTFGVSHVWKSTNAGANWTAIDGTDIPDIPVHSIVVDPTDSDRLFVGTDLGVFASTDGGASWAVENTGFANVVTEALAVQPGGTNLFAFTHGRGAWNVPLQVVTPAAVGNRVWSDTNVNGIQDPGEPGISGATVRLLNSIGTQIGTTTTDSNGFYLFEALSAGDYVVEFVRPSGKLFTARNEGSSDTIDSDADLSTGRTGTTSLGATETEFSLDAGLAPDDFITLGLNKSSYGTGDKLVASVLVNNKAAFSRADFYFVVLLPDGNTIAYFKDFAFNYDLGSMTDLSTLSPIAPNENISVPFVFMDTRFFETTLSGLTPGNYTMFLAAVVPGGFQDGVADPNDVLGLSMVDFTFSP